MTNKPKYWSRTQLPLTTIHPVQKIHLTGIFSDKAMAKRTAQLSNNLSMFFHIPMKLNCKDGLCCWDSGMRFMFVWADGVDTIQGFQFRAFRPGFATFRKLLWHLVLNFPNDRIHWIATGVTSATQSRHQHRNQVKTTKVKQRLAFEGQNRIRCKRLLASEEKLSLGNAYSLKGQQLHTAQ